MLSLTGAQVSAMDVSTFSRKKDDGTMSQQRLEQKMPENRSVEVFCSPEVNADPKNSKRARGSFSTTVGIAELSFKPGCNRGEREQRNPGRKKGS